MKELEASILRGGRFVLTVLLVDEGLLILLLWRSNLHIIVIFLVFRFEC